MDPSYYENVHRESDEFWRLLQNHYFPYMWYVFSKRDALGTRERVKLDMFKFISQGNHSELRFVRSTPDVISDDELFDRLRKFAPVIDYKNYQGPTTSETEPIFPGNPYQQHSEYAKTIKNNRYLILGDYTSPNGIFYPSRFQGMKYEVYQINEERRSLYRPDPELVFSKEYCDLELKNPNSKLDPSTISFGLFILYLDEVYTKNFAKKDSRFIFTLEQFEKLYRDGRVWQKFYLLPFVPPKIHFYSEKRKKNFPNFNNIKEVIDDFFNHRKIKFIFQFPVDDEIVVGNLNGSVICFLLLRTEFNDIDVRVDYLNSDKRVSDEHFDKYALKLRNQNLSLRFNKIETGSTYKYKLGMLEIYRAPFGSISNYHVAPVRANYDGENFHFFPSAMMALATGVCPDIRYFASKTNSPMEIVKKYSRRGFTFLLNASELAQMYEERIKNGDWTPMYIFPTMINYLDLNALHPLLIETLKTLNRAELKRVLSHQVSFPSAERVFAMISIFNQYVERYKFSQITGKYLDKQNL